MQIEFTMLYVYFLRKIRPKTHTHQRICPFSRRPVFDDGAPVRITPSTYIP